MSAAAGNSGLLTLWTLEEAQQLSIKQIGKSACGATALINAFSGLGLALPDPVTANEAVRTHLRCSGSGLVPYLRSRYTAGATPDDLLQGCRRLAPEDVVGSFHSYSSIMSSGLTIIEWCYRELCNGGVPILCMNLQKLGDVESEEWIPDAWHHQMVFGADLENRCLLLTNPLSLMSEAELNRVLDSDNELLVRDDDVIIQAKGDDPKKLHDDLSKLPSEWQSLSVRKNVFHIIERYVEGDQRKKHQYLRIPAAYTTGATLLRRVLSISRYLSSQCNRSDGEYQLHYTAHRNWSWVIDAALNRGLWGQKIVLCRQSFSRDMPSRVGAGRVKPQYALFRLEFVLKRNDYTLLSNAWAISPALEYLDPKDSLYKSFCTCGVQNVMPFTVLLPWNCSSEIDIPENVLLNSEPFLLKAALGSGGYGLYFVHNRADVIKVIKNHASKADGVSGFVENLKSSYGDVPSWSLQYLVPSLRLSDGRKCQFRAYILLLENSLYIYETMEARIVCWDLDVKGGALTEDEAFFCDGTSALPYNHGRMKTRTSRVLVTEMEELRIGEDSLKNCTTRAFVALRPEIELRIDRNTTGHKRIAVAAVDLLLDDSYNAYIVEINNNPAIPAENKQMSVQYKEHLVTLVSDTFKLGLSGLPEGTMFSKLW